jgi:hypothetical protein
MSKTSFSALDLARQAVPNATEDQIPALVELADAIRRQLKTTESNKTLSALDLALVAVQKATEDQIPALEKLYEAIRRQVQTLELEKEDALLFGDLMDTKGADEREKKAGKTYSGDQRYRDFCHLNWSANVCHDGKCTGCGRDKRCHYATFCSSDLVCVHYRQGTNLCSVQRLYWHIMLCNSCRKSNTGILYHPRVTGTERMIRIELS